MIRKRSGRAFTGITLAGVLVFSASVEAQRRPEPPKQKKAVVSESSVTPEFLAAYKRAGSPGILVYGRVKIVSKSLPDALNEASVAPMLMAKIRERLWHREIRAYTLDQTGRDEHEYAEELEGLYSGDAQAAEGTLADKLIREDRIRIVVLVWMSQLTGRADGATYAAKLVVRDIKNNVNLGEHSFDMDPKSPDGMMTSRRLDKYAVALARKITEKFIRAYPPGTGTDKP